MFKLKKIMRWVLYLIIITLLAFLFYTHRVEVINTFIYHRWVLLYVTGITILGFSAQALNFLQLIETLNKPPFQDTLRAWALANIANYLGPFQPGIAVRMAFFKRHGIEIPTTIRATLHQLQLSFWVATGIAAIAGSISHYEPIRPLAFVSGILFISWPLGLRASHLAILWSSAHIKFIDRHKDMLAFFFILPPARTLLLVAIQYILGALSLYVVYWSFDTQINIQDAFLLTVVVFSSTFIAITPNNLGVQDAIYGYSAYLYGLTVSEALSLALLLRLAHILACGLIVLLIRPCR
ncbi:lysylphosphatidylglycerol synthase domain-containing protein [Nitrosococcus watsonii]|uniref:Lysylphosphatidylglycerol synthetase/UPF0104 n=1 Tax=Nitrosococcus watsoni (strain C-113) TaxID=105559 RepID=D8K9W5_NITWC|nr:lysylphosphatidylglycerol synthase domain-containing protein [Nitrosococcus watsonii]ADJ29323.1 hypothetical protein Nwat_2534 [Nitrosococcus watsonii C-113]